jgi:cell division protein FtsB
MLVKIKTYYKRIHWQSLRDVRTIGLLVLLVIVLLVTWSGVKTIDSNYGLEQQVATLQQQNQIQQLENGNLQLQNDYYNSNQYLELSARQNLGLGNPGETELIVPQNVALAHLAPIATSNSQSTKPNARQPWYERNFEAWIDFYFHRQSSSD